MNHILIFEAFSSKTISKTLSFIDKKVGSESKIRFIKALNHIKNQYDYPIDKISDKYIDYLSKKNAVFIKSDDQVDNKFGIYCIKFWFSVENGYLGYTGVGNKQFPYNKKDQPKSFDPDEVEYLIKNHIVPDKGILTPILDYNDLNHLDNIVFYINDDSGYYKRNLVKAVIWKEGDRLYAIQNKEDGTNPNRDGWEKYGNYAWSLGSANRRGKDHFKIHKYEVDDEPLRVKSEPNITIESIYDYNLPIYGDGELGYWSSNNDTNVIDHADFSIILYFDNMMKNISDEDSPSKKSSLRTELKSGSTSFMSDSEIKHANIERYISELIKSIGITKNELTLRNLQKVILMVLNNKFSFMSCRLGYIHKIDKFITRLSRLMESLNGQYGDEEIQTRYNYCFSIYKEIYLESIKRNSISNMNISKIINYYSDNKDILFLINKMIEIGEKISNNISQYPTNNLTDLKIIYFKLKTIRTISNGDDGEFYISSLEDAFRSLMEGSYESSIYYFSRLNSDNYSYKESKTALINIEKYIDSIFK